MIHQILMGTLLAAVAATCWAGAIGAWRMREPVQSLHYLALPATLGAILLTCAAFLSTGASVTSFKTLLICVILVLTNSVGSHATARAIRTRQVGDWKGNSDKRFRFTGEVGKV